DLIYSFSGRLTMWLMVIFCGSVFFLIYRTRHSLVPAGKILNAIVALLLAWNIGLIVLHHLGDGQRKNARAHLQKTDFQKPVAAALKPDIYCFFVDEFASLETIREIFHHDHALFAERLQAAGFFIARRSRGLYVWTPEAIAAALNMEKVPPKTDAGVLIRQNKVTRFLKEQGYRIFDFPYEGLTALDDAERHFTARPEQASFLFNDFYKTLIDMSVFYTIGERWQKDENKYARFFRDRVLYVFDEMPEVVKMAGPKFVLVHLFSPHAPFVFARDGGRVPPEHFTDYSERKYYLEQYLYISRRLAETMEMILRESATAPIIVLQSDHGYRGSFRKPFLHVVSAEEKKKVFLAVNLPGYPQARLDDRLSPLNVFRIILNHYFGQNLPEIPNGGT
ncbi:MAG TPA: hypothetical protein VLQ89_03170, partial [Candidatus Binatia bacterium]|nr:hypothetical protein [Candidatus Binatia bacterium]